MRLGKSSANAEQTSPFDLIAMHSLLRRRNFSSSSRLLKVASTRVVFVEGVRIPFMLSGTAYQDLIAQDLGRMALKGLITKTAIDTSKIDYLTMGTVIQEG
jgi:hypothetical protein